MKEKVIMFLIVLAMALFMVACSADEPQDRTKATQEALLEQVLVQAKVSRHENVELSSEEERELIDAHNQFAFDFYAMVMEKARDSNLIYSPLSISQAFSMVYAGARGETETQMADVFYYLPQERQHAGENWLSQKLESLAEPRSEDIAPFEFHIASAVWGQKGFAFGEPYLTTLAEHYGAGLRVVDFAQKPDDAVNLINAWIAQQTEDRIQDLASRSTITPQTVLVLANAVYFNASWYFRFDESATQDGAFTLLDGQQVTVPLMQQEVPRVSYIEGDDYQAIQLPYTPAVSMLIILPEEGEFDSIQERLSTDFFDEIDQIGNRTESREVTLAMPRFDFESELDLAELLPKMGMPNAFSIGGAADFSGIAEGADLHIGAALHRANITVDEKGTEASAATLAVIPVSEVEDAEMIINRPFIFAIVERERGTILFLGRVMNPAQTEASSVGADVEDPLSGTRWQLLAFANEALPEQAEMWVEFQNGDVSIRGGCNSVGGSYELNKDQITMGLSKTTEVDCSQEKPGANEIERAFFTALRTFESYSIKDDELRIRYAEGDLLLRRLLD